MLRWVSHCLNFLCCWTCKVSRSTKKNSDGVTPSRHSPDLLQTSHSLLLTLEEGEKKNFIPLFSDGDPTELEGYTGHWGLLRFPMLPQCLKIQTIVNETQDANSSRRSNKKEKLSVSYHNPYKGLTRLPLLQAKAVSCLFLGQHGLTNCSTSTCTITGRCNMTLVLNWFLQSAMQLEKRSPCAPGFTLTGQCVRADSVFGPLGACSAAVAACNMWPQRLPASPASIFHYSLFNPSPCCWTAVPSLTTFTSCQESLRPNCFPTEENWFIRQQGNWILWGHKTWQLKTWYWRFRLLVSLGSNLWLIWSNRLWHLTSTDKVQENEEPSARLPDIPTVMKVWMEKFFFFFHTNQYRLPICTQFADGFLNRKL